MANYLVTGAAGFIASQVCRALLEQGHSVTGVDNLNDAYPVRLKTWRLERLEELPGFEFQTLDIRDRHALAGLFGGGKRFDAVLNLAARAGVRQSVEDPWVYMETNATGTLNLLDLCRRFEVPKFVLSSTSSLYGCRNPLPYPEDADTGEPLSPYAASKKAAEALCHSYHHLHGIDVSVLRYFTVYGPAGRPDMSVFRFVQRVAEGRPVVIYGDGRQSRDFTYIDDIARGTVAALKPAGFTTINLGSDRPVVLLDLLKQIEQCVGRKARVEHRLPHRADVPATWADIRRARQQLGWEPSTDYQEGIARSVAWYLDNRDWASGIEAA
ncbi:MAG: GDP-mannose 4,6-dehydratase [Bryobacterales bacterium]|nr:GDP-mannose 4,6-dehydratase [Bryobacterales bacterium]